MRRNFPRVYPCTRLSKNYTFNCIHYSVTLLESACPMDNIGGRACRPLAKLVWEGNSLEVLRSFPAPVREEIGAELRRLQLGVRPMNSRPMKTIGMGIFEIREQDERSWYRVIYKSRIGECIHVLHCFQKHGRKTRQQDLLVARARLAKLIRRIR